MKFIKGKRLQNGQDRAGRYRALQSSSRNRLRLAATNKVKRLHAIKKQTTNKKLSRKMMSNNNNTRVAQNVVDARVKLLQKAIHKPTEIVDARQKLSKLKDAREKIQQRHLQSTAHDTIHNVDMSRGNFNNLGRVKIDRRGILTVKSILDERPSSSRHNSLRDRQSLINQGRFDDVERVRSSNTFNSELNTFRSDRLIEEIRPTRHDMKIPRRPISNSQTVRRPSERSTRPTRVHGKPYSRPMMMDYDDPMDWEETNRYSPSPVVRRSIGNAVFNRDEYHDDFLDRNSRNQRGLSETLRSRLDSQQIALAKRARPIGHKIVISNLEPSVTSEDIKELFADIGILIESRVVRPGVAEVIYERRADAIQAVDVYHNRQLDGRPMKCDMVRNVGSNNNPMSGTSRRMFSRSGDPYKTSAYVGYDIDAVHTALFNK